jgi:penicillin-binding protein 1A
VIRPVRALYNLTLIGGLLALGLLPAAVGHLMADLPSPATLREVRLPMPLRIYSRDSRLIAEFGAERREPVMVEDVPPALIQAVLAAEDAHFFDHPGVDWQGLARAAVHLVKTGERRQGGSTITMQVAREFFLGREKTFARKLTEILLALRMEQQLTKREILELYLNKTFFGQRAYGVAAAAQVYYGKGLEDLSLSETAMIAGLPQAPSRLNPVADPAQAIQRRNYVLRRMHELGYIDDISYAAALAAPDTARLRPVVAELEAPHLAEMVRVFLEGRFGEDTYAAGLRVHTTLDGRLQEVGARALRGALLSYDARHGYRGPEGRVDPSAGTAAWDSRLAEIPAVADLVPAVIVAVAERTATARVRGVGEVRLEWAGLSWARRQVDADHREAAPRRAADVVAAGDIVRVQRIEDAWRLAQSPAVEGALVAIDPGTGAVRALVGGFDFNRSQFNRVTQSLRQPGSSFKPFIYSAALERGYTAASVIDDEPVAYVEPGTGKVWRPENYDGEFHGPTRLREGLAQSRNVVAVRLLEAVGVNFTVSHAAEFGLNPEYLPRSLALALGSGGASPLELARGYAVFANGGFRVDPYFIERVEDASGRPLFAADPPASCPTCAPPRSRSGLLRTAQAGPDDRVSTRAPRVLDPRNAWVMHSMLGDVIRRGTARAALALKRSDLAGKTGTTNDFQDAWFAGYHPSLVAVTWVGFDQLQTLGKGESGSRAALPMWIDFMREALAGTPEVTPPKPADMITARVDPYTGELAYPDQEDAVSEEFPVEFAPAGFEEWTAPPADADAFLPEPPPARRTPARITEELF